MILYVISVGLSVTMGLMGFINLAHGVFAMAGGYILSTAMAALGLPFPLAVLVAFVAVAAGSVVLERLLYSRLYAAGELAQVLFSIGLILMSMAIARLVYGNLAAPVFLPEYLRGQVHILGRDFPTYRVFIIIVSALLIAALWFGVERTRWGAMVRAGRQPRDGAVGGHQHEHPLHGDLRARLRPRGPRRRARRGHPARAMELSVRAPRLLPDRGRGRRPGQPARAVHRRVAYRHRGHGVQVLDSGIRRLPYLRRN